jgi:hypothetical protein
MNRFRTYDPTTKDFDPSYSFEGAKVAGYNRSADLAQVDIRIAHSRATIDGGTAFTLELFNNLRSVTKILNSSITTLNPATIDNLKTVTGSNPQNLSLAEMVYFDKNGNLIYNNSANAGGAQTITVSGNQVSYRSLFDASGSTCFRVENLRLQVVNEPQIDNQLTWFSNSWLGGVKQNVISPRAYFAPNQFQTKTVDIAAKFNLDYESGLWYKINPGEIATFNFFINEYDKPSL